MSEQKIPPPVFERHDRSDVTSAVAAIADIATIAEGVLLIEKYGLSLEAKRIDDGRSVEWVCTDPTGTYVATAYSPMGAVFYWDTLREGDDDLRRQGSRASGNEIVSRIVAGAEETSHQAPPLKGDDMLLLLEDED